MARIEAGIPPSHNPWEEIGRVVHDFPTWMRRHWRLLTASTAVVIAGAGGAYALLEQVISPNPDTQTGNPTPASGSFNPGLTPESKGIIIPTLPTETATSELTPAVSPTPEKPRRLPLVISLDSLKKDKIGLVTWTPDQITETQNEEFANGIYRIPVPKDFLEIGGVIDQLIIVTPSGRRDQYPILKLNPEKPTQFILPSLASGQVERVTGSEKIGIKHTTVNLGGNKKLGITTPLNSQLLVKVGERVIPGQPLIEIIFSPDSEEQQRFEKTYKLNMVTVLEISALDSGIPFKTDILRDTQGKVVTIDTSGK